MTATTSPEPALLPVKDTARFLGIGQSKTWELVANGTLESVKIGAKRLIKVASAKALADSGTQEAA